MRARTDTAGSAYLALPSARSHDAGSAHDGRAVRDGDRDRAGQNLLRGGLTFPEEGGSVMTRRQRRRKRVTSRRVKGWICQTPDCGKSNSVKNEVCSCCGLPRVRS